MVAEIYAEDCYVENVAEIKAQGISGLLESSFLKWRAGKVTRNVRTILCRFC